MDEDRFQEAIAFVLKHEGGLTNDKDDPGGMTNFGISLRFLENSKIDINGDKKIDSLDITSLTKEQAIALYKKEFWDKHNINDIKNLQVAKKLFDMSVNLGAKTAITIFQESVNSICPSYMTDLKEDGILGNKTISRANTLMDDLLRPSFLLNIYISRITDHYYNLVLANTKLGKFLKGWMRRVYDD